MTEPIPERARRTTLKLGDEVTLPGLPPKWWQKLRHWLLGTKPPTRIRCLVTKVFPNGDCRAEPKKHAWFDRRQIRLSARLMDAAEADALIRAVQANKVMLIAKSKPQSPVDNSR